MRPTDASTAASTPAPHMRAMGRWLVPQVVVAFALLALVASVVRSTAILSDSVLVADGSIATADCFRARVGQVLHGTVAATGAGPTTTTIPAVDPAASFVLHSLSADVADADALASVELRDATTVAVTRPAGATGTVEVDFTVVEYACGVRVQRGTSTEATATRDVAIDPVAVDRAFATVSVLPSTAATSAGPAAQVSPTFPAPDALRLTAGQAPAGPGASWSWQVVEFIRGVDAEVQHLATTVADGSATTAVDLATPVDPTRTLVLATARGTTNVTEHAAVTARLVDGDTVQVERGASTGTLEVDVQVVQLLDGTVVQQVAVAVGDGAASATATPTSPVDPGRSTVVATSATWGGAAATGRVTGGGSDVGRVLGRFSLVDPSTVRVERSRTSGPVTWEAQVVTWGGPGWWNPAYGHRARIEVATTTATPAGYTLSVTLDHAAMVADGRALASGDDVRVVRHDGTGWTELDRVLADGSAWGRSDTTVLFGSVSAIPADALDTTYWLHHGATTVGAPPTDPTNVFLLADGFESGLADYSQRVTGTGWYEADAWTHRRTLTVPAGTVGADAADVTIPVTLSDPSMAGQVQPDGSDLRFTAADGTTELPHELARWDPATGTLVAWVRVPVVAAAAETTLLLTWGAEDAPARDDARAAWSGADGVWHLDEPLTGTSTHRDASLSGRTGVLAGGTGGTSSVAGVIGRGLRFAGDAERVRLGPLAADAGPITLSGWAVPTSTTGGTVLRADSALGEHVGVSLEPDGSGGLTVRAALRDALGVLRATTGGTLAVGTTAHVAASWDGTTLRAYLDGVEVAAAPVASREFADASLAAGASSVGAEAPFDGTLDELRLDTEAIDEVDLTARVAVQRDPASTTTSGSVQTGSWFGVGAWAARTPITIDAGVVDASGAGEDLTDFPFLVSLTDPALAASAAADGRDLVFTADDGVTRFDHEVDSWDPATGTLVAWVRIPTLSASVDTGLFLYHGNASAVDQQDAPGVFGDGYVAVHHLDDDPEAVAP